jgi:hypothetical protein
MFSSFSMLPILRRVQPGRAEFNIIMGASEVFENVPARIQKVLGFTQPIRFG